MWFTSWLYLKGNTSDYRPSESAEQQESRTHTIRDTYHLTAMVLRTALSVQNSNWEMAATIPHFVVLVTTTCGKLRVPSVCTLKSQNFAKGALVCTSLQEPWISSAHGAPMAKNWDFKVHTEGAAHRVHFEIPIFCSWAAEIPIFARNPRKCAKSRFYAKPHGKSRELFCWSCNDLAWIYLKKGQRKND